MNRLSRFTDVLANAIVYMLAVLACCPLLALDGARSLLRKLGVRP